MSFLIQIKEPTAQELRAQSLLKEATEKHDANDLRGAMSCLRKAYTFLEKSSGSYPIETYLRLPLYQQKAGLFQEALESFNALLQSATVQVARDFSHQDAITQLSLVAMNRHIIYDKMRVACKREKRPKLVALYGLLSHASWCEGLHLQKRADELSVAKSNSTWQARLDKLFTSTEIRGLQHDALNHCLLFSKHCTEEAFAVLRERLTTLLS